MSHSSAAGSPARMMRGTAFVLMAEALALPTGLVTAGVLTRTLGPHDYGLLTLAATLVAWVQWSITSMLARPTIRFVSQADDPPGVARTVVRLHAVAGLCGLALTVVCAGPAARWLGEPALSGYVMLFGLDVVAFVLAQAHRNVLIGLGRFAARAWASAGRWLARLVLIVALVYAGFGVAGAIWGSIGASLVELAIARWSARPLRRPAVRIQLRHWIHYAAPLGAAAVMLRLFEKLDLVLLKGLGATAAEAGIYGAAQNLSTVPGMFALSFSPLLLSSIGLARAAGDHQGATRTARVALRVTIGMAPFLALATVSAPELVRFVFGAGFEAAGPILAILLGSAMALLVISVATAVMTAFDRPLWAPALTLPLVPVALAGHLSMIPRFGAAGAAAVTTLTASAAAIGALILLHWRWAVLPMPLTWLRAALTSVLVVLAAGALPVEGAAILAKLVALSTLIVAAYIVLGELSRAELARLLDVRHPATRGAGRAGTRS
jgi:O-antigen/teichoic acid export membrane protein